jgi:flavin-dependent dehydrogenase
MNLLKAYDVIIVGGGPAGSTCAAHLVQAGISTLLVDSNQFPRVKLCAGWLSAPVWDTLAISPKEYPHGLWQFDKATIFGNRDVNYIRWQVNSNNRQYYFISINVLNTPSTTKPMFGIFNVDNTSPFVW